MARSHPRLIIALDYPNLREAEDTAEQLAGMGELFKVGLELFSAEGPAALRAIADVGGPVFFDCKLMDIPNTVAGAVHSIVGARVSMFNVHTLGGPEMMRAAVQAAAQRAAERDLPRPLVLGVTILTSMDEDGLRELGVARPMGEEVTALAQMAREAGLDGVVASAHEIADIKQACGHDFLVVTPGIRPDWAGHGDQKRVTTPRQAAEAGADYVVVGRPITRAQNPVEAARRILEELAGE